MEDLMFPWRLEVIRTIKRSRKLTVPMTLAPAPPPTVSYTQAALR